MVTVSTPPRCDVLLVTVTEVETKALDTALTAATGREHVLRHGEDLVYRDRGELAGARVLHVRCEMGSDTVGGSAVTLTRALRETKASSVLMAGIAFGVDPEKQKVGTILVSKQLQGYDLQRIGTEPATQASTVLLRGECVSASPRILGRLRYAKEKYEGRRPIEFEKVLSGQKLIDNHDYRKQLERLCPEAKGGEMEGQGLYAAARDKAEWVLVKAVCDWADGNKSKDKKRKQKTAAKAAAEFVVHALKLGGFGPAGTGAPDGSEPENPADDEAVLAQHRSQLVSELSPVTVLRNIADNEAGIGQAQLRLEDVFVCPRLLPGRVQQELEAQDRRLLARAPREREQDSPDRRNYARSGELARWKPDHYVAAQRMTVGHALRTHPRLVVVGDPGAGKSALLAALVLATELEALSKALAGEPDVLTLHGRFPFFARLPDITASAADGRVDLVEALAESIRAPVPPKRAQEILDRKLRSEQALVVLDALDEVPRLEDRRKLAEAIESFARRYPKCLVVVSTRPSGQVLIHGFEPVLLPSMTLNGVRAFVTSWRQALGDSAAPPLDDESLKALGELGRNPLMLLVMLLSDSLDRSIRERVLFYDQALRTMLSTWRGAADDEAALALRAWGDVAVELREDGSGGVAPRQGLVRRLQDVLTAKGIVGAGKALAEELIEDAIGKTGLITKRGKELGFWHSTFGEYLAATAIARDHMLDRFLALRDDPRNVEVAVMTIDWLAHVAGDDRAADDRLRALIERRSPWDDIEGSQLAFAVRCLARGVHARPSDVDRCLLVLLRLCRDFPQEHHHHPTFARLAGACTRHVPDNEVIAELLRAVKDQPCPVALDVAVAMLTRACDRSPVAVEGCEVVLGRVQSSGIVRAFAALGLVRAGRLDETLLPALVGFRWFSSEGRHHRYSEDVLEPRTDGGSFAWQLRRALGLHEQRELSRWWSQEGSEAQRVAIGLLRALSADSTTLDEAVVAELLAAATSATFETIRDNARGMLGRIALRHPGVRCKLLEAALRLEADDAPPRRPPSASEPVNWAQAMLIRIIATDPQGRTWLMEDVARAAFSSLVERDDGTAVQFLRHILHALRGASELLSEAVRRRRNEPGLWPRLALFAMLLQRRLSGFGHPDEDLWLACVQSDDPWIRLTALESWHPSWSQEPSDAVVTAFVDSCMALLELGKDPPPDEALAVLQGSEHLSLGKLALPVKVEHWLERSLDLHGSLSQRVAKKLRQRLSTSEPEHAVRVALIIAEKGHAADAPEVVDVLLRCGLQSSDVDVAARAAWWLTKHGTPSRLPSAMDLQWAMLCAQHPPLRSDYAEEIRRLGPPSEALVHRMLERPKCWQEHRIPTDWLHSNPMVLEQLIAYMRDDEDSDRQAAAFDLLRLEPRNAALTNAIFEAARAGDIDACGRLTWLLHTRVGDTDAGQRPDLTELWLRVLASEDPIMLVRALVTLSHREWTGPHREAFPKALRKCLSTDILVVRLAAAWSVLWAAKEHQPDAATMSDAFSELLGVMELDVQELVTSLEACLDDPDAELRLLAVGFLIGLDAASESRERALQRLMGAEAARTYIFFGLMALNSGLSVGRLLELVLADLLPAVGDVVRQPTGELPNTRELAELVWWVVHEGAIPPWIDECFRSLETPRDERPWASRDPIDVTVALARSPLGHVHTPALRALDDAIRARSEGSWPVFRDAAALAADPKHLDIVMEWSMTMAQQRETQRVADDIVAHARNTPRIRHDALAWLRAALDSAKPDGDPQRAETAVRLMLGLGGVHGETWTDLTPWLRAHWRALPLPANSWLELVQELDSRAPDTLADIVWEIIEHFLAAEDPAVRREALDIWGHRPDRERGRTLAMQAWRGLVAAGDVSPRETCRPALRIIEGDPSNAELLAFLQRTVKTSTLGIRLQVEALKAVDRVPSERAWVEATALELLESARDAELEFLVDWFSQRWLAPPKVPETMPLVVARAIVALAASGRLPNKLGDLRGPRSSRDDALPVDTPFDSLIGQVLAEHLHEDHTKLRALFDNARADPGSLTPADSEHILRILRVQPTDDPTTRLARRWWHHQLHLDARPYALLP